VTKFRANVLALFSLLAFALTSVAAPVAAQSAASDCYKLVDPKKRDECVRAGGKSSGTTPATPATPAAPGRSTGDTIPATGATPASPAGGQGGGHGGGRKN